MDSESIYNDANKANNNKTKIIAIILGVIVGIYTLVFLVLGAMIGTNTLKIVATVNGRNITEIYTVCDNKVIDQWNKIYDFESHKSDSKYNVVADVNKLVSEIKNKPNYDKDITCQYFLYQDAMYRSDRQDLESIINKMKELHSTGVSVSDRVNYRQSISDIERSYNLFTASKK